MSEHGDSTTDEGCKPTLNQNNPFISIVRSDQLLKPSQMNQIGSFTLRSKYLDRTIVKMSDCIDL